MDVGLIILGITILFGAGLLFKSTGMFEDLQGGTLGKPEARPLSSPVKPALEFESPSNRGRGEFRICRNCLSENPMDSEYCANCGKKLVRPKDLNVSKEQRKWFRQFNWLRNPFTPDVIPSLFTGYNEQVEEILKKLSLHSGNILVLGDFGTGKTTLLRWLELNLPDNFHPIYVFRPPDKFSELIDVIAYSLDPSHGVKPGEYNIYNIDKLVQRINKSVVILIDEAHELDMSLNKSLKTLGDIENVNLVLAGLPKLEDKLKKEAPALNDRIVTKVVLLNLTSRETEELVTKRIENVGGWGHEPFTDDAVDEIFKLTRGNPRKVIHMCDCAVTEATTAGTLSIDKQLIVESCADKKMNVKSFKPPISPASIPEDDTQQSGKNARDLKSVVEERIRKLDNLYTEYKKAGDEEGIKEVISIAESTLAESKKHLQDASTTLQERERVKLMVEQFGDWLDKINKDEPSNKKTS
ncbi:MAG: AAA family ATPase [Candidatus Altiarchaeota archaeon]